MEENCFKNHFELCARGVIRNDDKILICWHKLHKYYFFPGGHVEFGESAEDALIRELKEELDIKVERVSFMGVVENIYRDKNDNDIHHEINFTFLIQAKEAKDKSLENHIDFIWMDDTVFKKEEILPVSLKEAVLKQINDGKIFWESQKTV